MSTYPRDKRKISPLGMTGEQFIAAGQSSIEQIEKYYSTIAKRPVLPSISPGYLQKILPDEAPFHGEDWETIVKDLEGKIMPGMTHWQHPKFMAFFPSSSTYPAILGEMWSAALNLPAFNWICSPAVTELETITMDWLAKILCLPETFLSKSEGGGVIQGTASEAIVTVMVAARERYIRRQLEREGITGEEAIEDRSCELRGKLVAFGSEQAHSSTKKGAIVAGLRFRSIKVEESNDYEMEGQHVLAKLDEAAKKGLLPCYLNVSIGTTNTCAIDDLKEIAKVLKKYPDVWVHCDAAHAGAALCLPEYQYLSSLLSYCDSFDLNLHKWLLVNFDASCLFVQHRKDLINTFSIAPAYLQNTYSSSGLVTDYRDWSIPLGRRFRALKIWFVLRTWGIDGLRKHVEYHIALGELFAELLRTRSDLFSILTTPRFALTVFTVRKNNELTKKVLEKVEEEKEYFLTSSTIGDTFAIRVVSANPMAEEKYVRDLFEKFVKNTEAVLGEAKA
ncbi:hypothetical protein K470DRAFT_255347 [Piedraia hortae CBS 480.64]|uniref:Aromatic-L-amino-acid decarboxylase n=1 Tax=Piedraia hortae CBS 480.64 TaxID=1314780 RepID=A0A6A7C6U6_9PEZI|nr:hypothetical protein K470DRAFT_255347 [Piedraia hortae CBS 480.64]